MLLTTDILRLRCDVKSKGAPLQSSGADLIAWLSCDLTLELGVFLGEVIVDPTNWTSLVVQIKDANSANPKIAPLSSAAPLAQVTVLDFDATATKQTWDDGTKTHASVVFSAAQMNFSLTGEQGWMIVTITTTDGATITPAAGPITLRSTGQSGATTTPPDIADFIAYSKNEADARFMPLTGTGYRKRDGYLQLYDATTATWHPLFMAGGAIVVGPADLT